MRSETVSHERVDVVPPPRLDRAEPGAVRGVGRGIRDRLPAHRVRIEVVVEVHAVEVVVLDRVQDRLPDVLLGLGQARVEVELAAVGPDPLGMHARGMLGHEPGRVGLHRDAVRVEPRVQLEVAPVRLVDDEGERVVARVAALHAREVLRPRLERAGPERVGGRPHLHEHRIQAELLGDVEPVQELGLLRLGAQPGARGPVDVHDRGDPHRAQLALPRRHRVGRGTRLGGERGARRERADRDREGGCRGTGDREGEEPPSTEVGLVQVGVRVVEGHRRSSKVGPSGRYFHTKPPL